MSGMHITDVRFVEYNAFDDDPWILQLIEFVKVAYNAGKPLVGICFGHQIIARALGGKVTRSTRGWEVAVDKIDLTTKGALLFGKDTLVS
jgi:GMP synthase-like glutamine amidotransferase